MKKVYVLMILGGITSGGGAEMMVMNYYRNINMKYVQIDYVVHGTEKGSFDDEIINKGSRIYKLPVFSKNLCNNIRELYRILKNNKYDIVHVHMDTMAIIPLYIAKKAGVHIRIAHSHTTSYSSDIGYMQLLVHKFARSNTSRYATRLFACSRAAGEFLFGKNFMLHENAKILNNAINLELFKLNNDKRNSVRKELGINGRLVIGHVGRFVHPKNHNFLIDIFYQIKKKHPNSILVLCGTGNLMNNIKEKVCNLGIEKDVLFLGMRNDIPNVMQAMDVFLLPSYYEGLPVVAVEAQSSGLLCFMSDKITKETDFTAMNFISLKSPAEEWADEILEGYKKFCRKDKTEEAKRAGFDITTEAKKLEKFYLDF